MFAARVYDVTALVPPSVRQRRFGPKSLFIDIESLDVIRGSVSPANWAHDGGQASFCWINVRERFLFAVTCDDETHRQIDDLLAALGESRRCQKERDPKHKDLPDGVPVSLGGTARHPLYAALAAAREFEAIRDMPLDKAIERFGRMYEVPVIIDRESFNDAGIAMNVPISSPAGKFSGYAALDGWLHPHELSWIIRHDVVFIASKSATDDIVRYGEARVYPVADLVGGELAAIPTPHADYDSLLQIITGTVAPTTWTDVGGAGPNKPYPPSGAIVINQTRQVHAEIEQLLTALRKARGQVKPVEPPPIPEGLQVRVFTFSATPDHELIRPPEKKTVPNNVQGQLGGPTVGFGYYSPPSRTWSVSEVTRVAKRLSHSIPQILAPDTWKANGGQGTIHAVGTSLIVRQEQTVIDDIAALLLEMGLRFTP